MDLKPLLHVCRTRGTTTALLGLIRARMPEVTYLLVGRPDRADVLARTEHLSRRNVVTVHEAGAAFAKAPGVLLCDTDALLELQGEIDRLESRAVQLEAEVRELTAWQVAARHMATIKAEEVRDLSATVGELQETAALARKYLQHYRREWKCAEDLRYYGELQRRLAQAVGVEWPLDDGAAPPPSA